MPLRLPSKELLSDRFRIPLEQTVSQHYRREWRAQAFTDLDDFSSHPCAILSDGSLSVFVKLSQAANALDQFEVELVGLHLLSDLTGVLTPSFIGLVPVEGGVILAFEAVQAVERSSLQWRQIGQTLARIHMVKGEFCGLEHQGYFGPLYQDNRPTPDWLSFYTERRLWPRLVAAIDSGNLPTENIRMVEKLIARLPRLGLPECKPVLLHGDAQQNNFISTAQGAMVIDPAVYYGNPELDLAYVDYFQPMPPDVFEGYREVLPIDPGFPERRELWRISAILAVITVEGVNYLDWLNRSVQKYL